jgi:aspartyl aminopeptidase
VRTALVDFRRPLLRIPNLAIHLQRELHKEGLKLNAQQHLAPLIGLEDAPPLPELVAGELRASGAASVDAADVLAFDLMTYDTQPANVLGARGEFLCSPRLDNLVSCHAAVTALCEAADASLGRGTRMVVLYDHEEVGSRSAQGAGGTLLVDALERTVSGFKGGSAQGAARAASRSLLVSADMAHAVHPNYADRHEAEHRPVVGKGPVIKVNANQSYASDAETAARFAALCAEVGVAPQHFVVRSDLACGSTIGPISAARVGIRTVDVGSPMLAMHSCRELAGTADVAPMIDVLRALLREA